jgi:hypothetical protein
MCNAFNHPRHCMCGWGSDELMGYSNSYGPGLELEFIGLARTYMSRGAGSHLRPNYQCKCCGQKVYFFQSKNGGKVLFEALGKPWPKHECLVMTYLRKKETLNISSDDWHQVSDLVAAPSNDENASFFTGVTYGESGSNWLKFRMAHSEPLLIKDVYLDSRGRQANNENIEALVILDDGSYGFFSCILETVRKFELQAIEGRKFFKGQPKLF